MSSSSTRVDRLNKTCPLRERDVKRRAQMPQSQNRLLNVLPQNIFTAVERELKPVGVEFGTAVARVGQPVERVYFPHCGVISLVIEMQDGGMIETATVGWDGVVNGTSALDGKISLHKSIVQVSGTASAILPHVLKKLADEFEPLRDILIRHDQVLFAQAQQSAGCNASHRVEERMCRWLLRIRDLTGSDELNLTQEYLAHMLGVRRSSVSLIAGTLQRAGFIKYRRGRIRLLDIEQLQAGACECYQAVRSHYERLLMVRDGDQSRLHLNKNHVGSY